MQCQRHWVIAIGLCLLTLAAQPARAEDTHLGWSQLFTRDDKAVPAKLEPKARVVLSMGAYASALAGNLNTATQWSLDAEETTILLLRQKCLARGIVNGEGRTVYIVVYPQDFSLENSEQIIKHIVEAAQPTEDGWA